MTPEAALGSLLAAAAEEGARRALAAVAEQSPSRLIPVKQSPAGYRLTLDAVRRGELQCYRVGAKSFVERGDLEQWVLAHPVTIAGEPDAGDEVAEIIRANEARGGRGR